MLLALIFVALAVRGLPAAAECRGPQDLQAAVDSNPTAEAWVALGNWFGNQGRFDCAADALQSALRLDPESAQINYLLGLAYYEQQNDAAAVVPLQGSIAADSAELNPHLLLATVYSRLADPGDAATQWRAALNLDGGNTMALHGLSQALIALRDYSGEIRLLETRALDTQLAVDLAIAYSDAGAYDEAAHALRDALAVSPPEDRRGRILAQSMLAWILLLKGDATAALPEAREAAKEAPTLSLAQLSLGRALVSTGHADAAIPVLERARSLDLNNIEIHIALARSYAETGQSEQARAERELCLKMADQRGGSLLAGRKEASPAR